MTIDRDIDAMGPGPAYEATPRQRLVRVRLDSRNRLRRALWRIVWLTLFRLSPTPLHAWRRALLRAFGARIEAGAHPYPRARIWAPWNLRMDRDSCLADDVDCYCVAPVTLGAYATVSQYSFLCTASHDYREADHPLVAAPIVIGPGAWIAADAFIAPGVTIGKGAVVTARASVFSNVPALSVVGGNPAQARSRRPALSPWAELPDIAAPSPGKA